LERFRHDDPADVAAVLKDLVDSGLVSRAGRGDHAFYQLASSEAVAAMAERQHLEAVANFVWLAIYDRQEIEREALFTELPFEREAVERAIDVLSGDGRIALESRGARTLLVCRRMVIPLGAEQ